MQRARGLLGAIALLTAVALASSGAGALSRPVHSATARAALRPAAYRLNWWHGPKGRVARGRAGIRFGRPVISGIQGNGFEQDIRIDRHVKGGPIYTSVPGALSSGTSWVWRSVDGGLTFKWVPAAEPLTGKLPTCAGGGDTELAVDSKGHLYFNDLTLANFSTARSDDRGRTFTPPNCTSVDTSPDDRQWYATDGDPTHGGDLYLAYNVVAQGNPACGAGFKENNQLVMARSPLPGAGPDAGVHFAPAKRITGPCDEGIMGNVEVSPRTHHILVIHPNAYRTAIRLARCHRVPFTTDPSGLACSDVPVATFPHTGTGNGTKGYKTGSMFPDLAVDRAGNLYAVWQEAPVVSCGSKCTTSGDVVGDTLLFWSSSRNEGKTWTKPVQVPTPKLHNNVYSWAAAGSRGRVDIAWYGTGCTETACPQKGVSKRRGADSTDGRWSLYFTQTTNGLRARPTFLRPILASEHFIHRGGIFTNTGRQEGNRDLGDFLQMRVGRKGEAEIAYADTNSNPTFAPHGMFVRQVLGRTANARHPQVHGYGRPRQRARDRRGDARYQQSGSVSGNIPKLDILSSRITRPTATQYLVRMKVADLRGLAPVPATRSEGVYVWLTQWLVPSKKDPDGGADFFVYMESSGGSKPTFWVGKKAAQVQGGGVTITYPGDQQVKGSYKPGKPGLIRIVVPARDVHEKNALDRKLYSVTASTMALQSPAESEPSFGGIGGVPFDLIDVVRPYDYVRKAVATGHGHTDYSGNHKAGSGDVHVLLDISREPHGRPNGTVRYFDLRSNPPGAASKPIHCYGESLRVTKVTKHRIRIRGKASCKNLGQVEQFTLTVTDRGANPPLRDRYRMVLYGKGAAMYVSKAFTTPKLGDLKLRLG